MKTLVLISTLLLSLSVQASFWLQDGSVTNKKLAPAVIQKSAAFTFTSASPTALPTITINRTGRPVMVSLEASSVTDGTSAISVERTVTGTNVQGVIRYVKDLVTMSGDTFGTNGPSGTMYLATSCSAFSYIDATVETGNKVYAITVPAQLPNMVLRITECRLVVREL